MSKINCKATNCVSNRYCSCMKTTIEVCKANECDSICDSYKEKRFNDYKSEFAYQDFPMLFEVNVDCKATDCTHNRNLKCAYGEIEIRPLFEEGSIKINCATYHKK